LPAAGAGLWHGDIGSAPRAAIQREPPEILVTTPESLEAMLVSTKVAHRELFAGLRAVVIDEVHAFAGDDRGWHLLAVLSRLQHLAGRELQRVGLSATIGNPDVLLDWMTQGCRGALLVVAAGASGVGAGSPAEVVLDHVGSVANAATVISRLHRGEKRLVFVDSRARVARLGAALKELGMTTFVSHSSLSRDERRRAEEAFTTGQDCDIVATSTLELGVDVGDLDRVIQVDAPPSVASFLQRLGRTGRRPGTGRNMLILATRGDALLEAAAITRLWADGWVEPIVAPPDPWHLVAQQLLGLCLQEGRIGRSTWPEWYPGVGIFDTRFDRSADVLVEHLVGHGFLVEEEGMLSMGPEAERTFGYRHFVELTSVFTSDPLVEVLAGREQIGHLHPLSLHRRGDQAAVVALGGRAWKVEHIDWVRHRAWVRPVEGAGRSVWAGRAPAPFDRCSPVHRRAGP